MVLRVTAHWAPDGRVVCINERVFSHVDPADGSATPLVRVPHHVNPVFDISPDGEWLFFSMQENNSELWVASPR